MRRRGSGTAAHDGKDKIWIFLKNMREIGYVCKFYAFSYLWNAPYEKFLFFGQNWWILEIWINFSKNTTFYHSGQILWKYVSPRSENHFLEEDFRVRGWGGASASCKHLRGSVRESENIVLEKWWYLLGLIVLYIF